MRKTEKVFRGTQQRVVVEALRGHSADRHARADDDRGNSVGAALAFVPRDHDESVAATVVRPGEKLRNPRRKPRIATRTAQSWVSLHRFGVTNANDGRLPVATSRSRCPSSGTSFVPQAARMAM